MSIYTATEYRSSACLILTFRPGLTSKGFLQEAILKRKPKSIKLLLSMDTAGQASIDPTTALHAALLIGNYEKACQQVAVCDYDSRVLFEAVLQSQRSSDWHKIVECLLETRQPVPNDDFEVLAVAHASIRHDTHLLGALMEVMGEGPWFAHFPDVDPSLDGHWQDSYLSRLVPDDAKPAQHILNLAATINRLHKDEKVIKALLKVNVPAKGMYFCIDDGLTAETWKQLIVAGLEPELEHIVQAARRNELTLLEVLCEAQVPLNTMHHLREYFRSLTAVQGAIESGSSKMLQMLVRYGADIDHPAGYDRGYTCLQLAAGNGNIGMVRLLLDKGAKVNAKRSLLRGRTAIETAAENGRLDVLKLLLLQEERLFQTAAERYQFIRASRFAEQEGHAIIFKMLRQHISWNTHDQQPFDRIQGSDYVSFHLDDMTQEVLESERREPDYWSDLDKIIHMVLEAGPDDIFDIEGIEQWVGKRPDNCLNDWTTSKTDCSTEEGNVQPKSSLTAGQQRNAECDELPSNLDGPSESMPKVDNIDDVMMFPDGLQDERVDEHTISQPPALSLHPWRGRARVLAPRAIHSVDKAPAWLDDLQHRTVTEDVGRMPGMILGEVLGEGLHIDGICDDAVDPNIAEDVSEGEHPKHFDWGFWDNEGIGRTWS